MHATGQGAESRSGRRVGVFRWGVLAVESRAVDEEALHSPRSAPAVSGAGRMSWYDREIDVGGDRIWDAEVNVALLEVPGARGSGATSIVASLEFLAVRGG